MSLVTSFFAFTDALSILVLALVIADIITILWLIWNESFDPRTSLSWLILLIVVPPVGVILNMYMGNTRYKDTVDRHDGGAVFDDDLSRDTGSGYLTDRLRAMAGAFRSVGTGEYTSDNEVHLYTEGREYMDDVFADLRRAKEYILVEYYIVRDDLRGNELFSILTEKVRSGIEVRLLCDSFGMVKGPQKAIKEFIASGGDYVRFHSWRDLFFSPKKNHRNHRKIIVVDGEVAYCGGFNIGDEYEGKGPLGHWRDAAVRMCGGSVRSMIAKFADDWGYSTKHRQLRSVSEYIRTGRGKGDVRVQSISGGPDTASPNPVQMQYLSMITNAKKRLYVCTPYLVPDQALFMAMSNAVDRGVDVRVLMPDKKDHIFLYWNNLTAAYDLMKRGIRVFRYNDGFIHEKAVVMDDGCCSVGSANMDHRSLTLNYETNIMLYSKKICDELADRFLNDLSDSTEYSCKEYESAPVISKMRMSVSRLFELLV